MQKRNKGIGHIVRNSNMCLIENPKRKKKKDKAEAIGEEIRAQDFPELIRYQYSDPRQNK